MSQVVAKELINFIEQCPSVFHAIDTIKTELLELGYEQLNAQEDWELEKGKGYFISKNDSSIIAFKSGHQLEDYSFNIVASHSDSPCFKIKPNAEIVSDGHYIQLNTEGYGGMIMSSWMDRPLSIAGRIIKKENQCFSSCLVNLDYDLCLIPQVAIHINRTVNEGQKFNPQVDMLPMMCSGKSKENQLMHCLQKELNIDASQIVGHDLYLYNRESGKIWGSENEYISIGKLDDLQCAFASLKAFETGINDQSINLYCCFDNEEIGSATQQGAASTFLMDTLVRVNHGFGFDSIQLKKALTSSFIVSADNAHATHPNHPEYADPTNRLYLNEGVVIKHSASQSYTTSAMSAALFKSFCKSAAVPVQEFANKSDVRGGSTLGCISAQKVSITSVDIGLAQLAMHSSYETAGVKDTEYMIDALTEFYNSHLTMTESNSFTISK